GPVDHSRVAESVPIRVAGAAGDARRLFIVLDRFGKRLARLEAAPGGFAGIAQSIAIRILGGAGPSAQCVVRPSGTLIHGNVDIGDGIADAGVIARIGSCAAGTVTGRLAGNVDAGDWVAGDGGLRIGADRMAALPDGK